MDIRVSRHSEIPVHQQLSAQLVLLIGTGALKPGTFLPSVRSLARRLSVHRNTVVRAYRDLTLNQIVEKRAGRRLAVKSLSARTLDEAGDLDDVVDVAIAEARERGYSLRDLSDRLEQRLRSAPADRVLVLSDDAGMRLLLPTELRGRLQCPVDVCTPGELLADPSRGLGAIVVGPQGHIAKVRSVVPRERPPVAITYAPAEAVLDAIRRLQAPSIVVVVSISRYFLDMARGLLAAVAGGRHELRTLLWDGRRPQRLGAADVVISDVVMNPIVTAQCKDSTVLLYCLIANECLTTIESALRGTTATTSRRRVRRSARPSAR